MRKFSALLFLLLLVNFPARSQSNGATVSGLIKDKNTFSVMAYANVALQRSSDSMVVFATISNEQGRFMLEKIQPGTYFLVCSYTGYLSKRQVLVVGTINNFLEMGSIELTPDAASLTGVTVVGKQAAVTARMDKKVFGVTENLSQAGGSVLDVMKNIPGVTTSQDGKISIRGSDKVMVLIDGKQTALTGFGGQSSLENIPASAIERIEIINNPSAKFDANGNAGIINIIYKKEKKKGFNGKIGISGGLGALWIKAGNYPDIRPQYQRTPKFNPSLSLNYKKNKVNLFLQADDLYTHTLNKNEFSDRIYDTGDTIRQQLKRNRITHLVTVKSGMDWTVDASNTFTISGLFSSEKIIDRGDQPFFNGSLTERKRLWQFLEDELKTTATASAGWQHKFIEPGRILNAGINYTFHREDEKYFFTNILPAYTGLDSFKLISDEHVLDLTIDYVEPLRYGRLEAGLKFRRRSIPTNMLFQPGINSPLDVDAGGWATYKETIPAVYGNYILENNRWEMEAGLRVEYAHLNYEVNPDHPTYSSDGYDYFRPFPNLRLAYKLNEHNKLVVFYNNRVDRPNEVDIRIFPKYDDAEIIKVGNPALRPQFTQTMEFSYKSDWAKGYLLTSLFHKRTTATIARIGTIVPGNTLIYNVFQNAGRSSNTGMELMVSHKTADWATLSLNLTGYYNRIDAFTILNKYPQESLYSAEQQQVFSGNIKLNGLFKLASDWESQLSAIYLAPDLIPQGKIRARFSIDMGLKKKTKSGKGEWFVNATDIANSLRIKREIVGDGFSYSSIDYLETQVIRMGYNIKF